MSKTKSNGVFFRGLILFTILVVILGCSRSTTKYRKTRPERVLSIFEKRMIEHRNICYYIDNYRDCSKEEVPRVIVDTLDMESTSRINDYINEVDTTYPYVSDFVLIKYYPGLDINNSTGTMTRDRMGLRNAELLKKVNSNRNIILLNVYKSKEGLERWNKNLDYVKDDGLVISSTFFKHHYPGSSYAILHKTGVFYAYYGEYMHEQQLRDIDLFMSFVNGRNRKR